MQPLLLSNILKEHAERRKDTTGGELNHTNSSLSIDTHTHPPPPPHTHTHAPVEGNGHFFSLIPSALSFVFL